MTGEGERRVPAATSQFMKYQKRMLGIFINMTNKCDLKSWLRSIRLVEASLTIIVGVPIQVGGGFGGGGGSPPGGNGSPYQLGLSEVVPTPMSRASCATSTRVVS